MKAEMPSVPPELLEWRRRTGADRWDEMWEGVLHMVPSPNLEHQHFGSQIDGYLNTHWLGEGRKVYREVDVASVDGWSSDYRCPDLLLLLPDTIHRRRATLHDPHIEGPPDVVIEIRSPDDESYEKLPFYASLGVPEVWIIDRDTKVPEIHVLEASKYVIKPAEENGWLESAVAGVGLRNENPGRLSMCILGDSDTHEELSPHT